MQEEYAYFMPSGKMFLTFNGDLSLKGNGYGSKASIVDTNSDDTLNGESGAAFYSYKNYLLKYSHMFNDTVGAYVNAGITERAFSVDYYYSTGIENSSL